MKNRVIILFGMTFLLTILGCHSMDIGNNFNDSYVSSIQKNVTTKAQIRQNIGEPHSVSTTTGMETWTYQFTDAYAKSYQQASTFGLIREKPTNKLLIIIFSGDKVADYNYTR